MDKNHDVITFILNYLSFRRPRVANFACIIKIATMFIKTTFEDTNKVKRIKNADFTRTQGACHVINTFLRSLVKV